jgi:tetratricopeptide (TPR) repeat protein
VTICADCLIFARQVLGDNDEAGSDEGRLDGDLLWSDLTPAPRPDVDPDAPATAHADLALAFFEMGLFDDAREQVGKALALDPRHPVALRIIEQLPPPGAPEKGR